MRYMEHLDGVLELIDNEFAEMERNGKFKSRDDIELVYKMMDIVKDAAEYCEKYAEMDGGYSEYGYPYPVYSERGAKRDSMGRYSKDNGRYGFNTARYTNRGRNYSRGDAKDDYMNQLHELMENAPDERTREHVQRMIHDMEQQ